MEALTVSVAQLHSHFSGKALVFFILDCEAQRGTATAGELTEQNSNVPVKNIPVNLRNPDETHDSITAVSKVHSGVDIPVNNAEVEIAGWWSG